MLSAFVACIRTIHMWGDVLPTSIPSPNFWMSERQVPHHEDPGGSSVRIPGSNNPRGVIIDYDKDGNIVGLEILDASTRTENPLAVEYAVVGKAA